MQSFFRISLVALVAACAEPPQEPPPPELDCPTEGRYLELATGRVWTYRVADGEVTESEKTQTVGELEDVGGDKAGVLAYRLTTEKASGSTISWQEDTGEAVLRHRELDMSGASFTDEIYEPHKTRIDESPAHRAVGASWTDTVTENVTDQDQLTTTTTKTEAWVVEAVDEVVQVPAGDFCALRVKRTSTVNGATGSVKTYWFARGVGKVREAGDSQIEELVSYR